jgi:hypothetical protein
MLLLHEQLYNKIQLTWNFYFLVRVRVSSTPPVRVMPDKNALD